MDRDKQGIGTHVQTFLIRGEAARVDGNGSPSVAAGFTPRVKGLAPIDTHAAIEQVQGGGEVDPDVHEQIEIARQGLGRRQQAWRCG